MRIHHGNYSKEVGRKHLENIATGDTWTEVKHELGMEEGVQMGGNRKVRLTVGMFRQSKSERIKCWPRPVSNLSYHKGIYIAT